MEFSVHHRTTDAARDRSQLQGIGEIDIQFSKKIESLRGCAFDVAEVVALYSAYVDVPLAGSKARASMKKMHAPVCKANSQGTTRRAGA